MNPPTAGSIVSLALTSVVFAPARDGVLIPARLTRLESTALNENTPMLIHVYGGFGVPGFLYPEPAPMVRDLFLKKGGVLVGLAIRGGNEFGQPWYEAASGARKTTSFHDVIDVAKFLASKKWTSPSRIILTGSSNGGFTAAGAALLGPESFGLVIPVRGVFDLMGLNRRDPNFADGWWDDYGNPDDLSQVPSIKTHAPLELAVSPTTRLPHLLFVSGFSDTRVNPLHTLKMAKKLRLVLGDSESLNAVFIKNSGHSISRPLFEDCKALRENLVVWDFIYQQLGW